jgi:Zn-finger nucleic acid-binding protein
MPRAVSKSKPISHSLLRKVRDRPQQLCPYCGTDVELSTAQTYRPEGVYILNCPKCTRNFWLPLSRAFDPSIPVKLKLGSDGWGQCPCCRVAFKFRRKYEQCPGCGKILIGYGTDDDKTLKDNETEALATIATFRQEHRKPWWRP